MFVSPALKIVYFPKAALGCFNTGIGRLNTDVMRNVFSFLEDIEVAKASQSCVLFRRASFRIPRTYLVARHTLPTSFEFLRSVTLSCIKHPELDLSPFPLLRLTLSKCTIPKLVLPSSLHALTCRWLKTDFPLDMSGLDLFELELGYNQCKEIMPLNTHCLQVLQLESACSTTLGFRSHQLTLEFLQLSFPALEHFKLYSSCLRPRVTVSLDAPRLNVVHINGQVRIETAANFSELKIHRASKPIRIPAHVKKLEIFSEDNVLPLELPPLLEEFSLSLHSFDASEVERLVLPSTLREFQFNSKGRIVALKPLSLL